MLSKPDSGRPNPYYTRNLALASTVLQVGCVTVLIIVGALLVGLWLDNVFDTRPILTIVSILVSIPVSLLMVVRIALSAAARIQSPADVETPEREEGEIA
jgi:F0F1-type ATP synthase assembly protein I